MKKFQIELTKDKEGKAAKTSLHSTLKAHNELLTETYSILQSNNVGLKKSHLCLSVYFQFQLRDDISSLHWGRFLVWASGLCSLYRGFCHTGVRCIGVLPHTFYGYGLKNIVRCTGDFVNQDSTVLLFKRLLKG